MKNRTLPLSLLIGAALTIPSLAMAAPAETAQADMQNTTTATTLETEAVNADNQSVPNQSNSIQISETQRISRASVNSNANQQQMAPKLQAQQQDQDIQVQQQEMQQAQQQAMQAKQQAMQQAEQQAMQDPEEAMQQPEMLQEDMLDEEDLLESEQDDQ
ncbi:hypothetical protein [Psychrobacter sp. PAMC 21119]|uniref:hypothetical protein n=1 Tax=Psychrobacter sp. PAMC 21119 TaxID=1112209 RepID=UPI0002890E98|nr:hypothetical protein [Psychrobacter sp. PAMC 21119]